MCVSDKIMLSIDPKKGFSSVYINGQMSPETIDYMSNDCLRQVNRSMRTFSRS